MTKDQFGAEHQDVELTFLHKPGDPEADILLQKDFWAWKFKLEGKQYGGWYKTGDDPAFIRRGFDALATMMYEEFMKFRDRGTPNEQA